MLTGTKILREITNMYYCVSVFRKRKGGIKLDDAAGGDADEGGGDEEKKNLGEVLEEEKKEKKEAAEKKKADDLWASFMSDVGQKPKPKPAVSAATSTSKSLASLSKVRMWLLSQYLKPISVRHSA